MKLKTQVTKTTKAGKVVVELDAKIVANFRRMLRATGTRTKAETVINEWLESSNNSEPLMGYLAEHVHGIKGWENHPDRVAIRARMQAVRDSFDAGARADGKKMAENFMASPMGEKLFEVVVEKLTNKEEATA